MYPATAVVFVFQSTRPVRGETTIRCFLLNGLNLFQSTRPVRGETVLALASAPSSGVFQSTRPVRGETSGMRG